MDKQYLAGGLSCVVFIPLTAAMISTDTHIFGPRQNHRLVHSGDDCLKSVQRAGPVQTHVHNTYLIYHHISEFLGGWIETYGTMSALGFLHVF